MPQGIVYPQGCRPVTDELGADELIRRLKTLAHTFQAMAQDTGIYQQYIPLALHLADDFFLQHQSKDVQLLIACCIADVLRVYAPEAPYKDPDQIKTIFIFIIKQLSGLKDPKDPAFKRYFYLLENLAYVKSFNMCFELEDNQEIFCTLFNLMFNIVNDEHSAKVKSFMLDIMCPLISESDMVSHELLDIILINVVEPNKTQRRNAYALAKELINKCSDTLEPYIQAFFNQVLLLGKEETHLSITNKMYDLIYELNKICPSVLLAVLPQLECKIKSTQESERLSVIKLLAKMFSEKNSNVAKNNPQLWRAFLGRFNDISSVIRVKCVQHTMHFLLNHPNLREDIVEVLKSRQHDVDENVRYEVVLAVVTTAKHDFEIISQSTDLLDCVKERTLDKKFKIRKEALSGLAMIYRNHCNQQAVSKATMMAVTWIKNKILHGYYMPSTEDRLLVEKLLNTSLVPYQLPPEEKMKRLYHLMGTVDDNACRAFVELQKHQALVRNHVKEWLEIHRKPATAERSKEISSRIMVLSRFLPEPLKVQEFLHQFSDNLLRDQALLLGMEAITRSDISCKDCAETVNLIIKKLGQPIMTNLYYNTVKMLLERMSSVMIDKNNLKVLITYVEDCIQSGNLIEELSLNPVSAGEKGLKLLVILSYIYPYHFLHQDIISQLINFLNFEEEYVVPNVLSVLTFLGKHKSLSVCLPQEMDRLIPLCKNFALTGTKKQAKQAVRCLYVNVFKQNENIFNDIIEKIKVNLTPTSEHYLVSIVTLGHIAQNVPQRYMALIKNLISRKIVRDLLVKKEEAEMETDPQGPILEGDWCPESDIPLITLCKIEGIKMMARWLLGLKNDEVSAQKTFRMFAAFVAKKGNLSGSELISNAEMSWLRLTAGYSMLKIAEQKGVGDQYTAEQFYTLSQLMYDEVPKVREIFNNKLHKGLTRGLPHRSIPIDFMGFFAFGGLEKDKQLKESIKQHMIISIQKRREFIKNLTQSNSNSNPYELVLSQSHSILPDYMLVYAIAVLAHCPQFTDPKSVEQLLTMKSCLWFIMEPLITKNDSYSYGIYKGMLDRIKTVKDALTPDDETANEKIWALCDLAVTIILTKTVNFEMKDGMNETKISALFYKKVDDPLFANDKCYLPTELQYHGEKSITKKTLSTANYVKKETGKTKQESIDYQDVPDKSEDEDSETETKKRRITRSAVR
ncbi:sister chromatid cohesion protein PDS5 homolog B [Planococcus citri]|uniref:sister chromatid cohesion protein PDS5 homolog B n=1 Tax=Planococcus citri TaxID=170843 RepID=UPI0031F8A3A5